MCQKLHMLMCVYSYICMGEVVYLGIEFLLAHRIPSGLWEPKREKKKIKKSGAAEKV